MSRIKRILLLLLIMLGVGLSLKLMAIYLNVNFNPNATPSFCNINDYVDCDGVAKTGYSRFFGIPMAMWGIFLYVFFFFLLFVDKIQKIRFLSIFQAFKNPTSYISALGLLSFSISIILAGVSILEIGKICILCFVTYFINLFIAITARSKEGGFIQDIKNSFIDFFDAIKQKKYSIPFVICITLFLTFAIFIQKNKLFEPPKHTPTFNEFAKMKAASYKISGNLLGDKNAKIVVNIYTDYNCPHCMLLNVMMLEAVKDLKGFMVIHHEYPLDAECNPLLRNSMRGHGNSCMLARYSLAAQIQDRGWDMNALLFDNHIKSEDEVLDLAKKIRGINIDKLKKDANSPEIKSKLNKDVEDAIGLNVRATPTTIIGSQIHAGSMPYNDLKQLLINAGAEPRK